MLNSMTFFCNKKLNGNSIVAIVGVPMFFIVTIIIARNRYIKCPDSKILIIYGKVLEQNIQKSLNKVGLTLLSIR